MEVGEREIALVEAIDGLPLPKGRLLDNEVDCNQFQDAERFLGSGGFKGPQVGILRPGRYRINTAMFGVSLSYATTIEPGFVGVVTAEDGRPLPPTLMVAPQPPTSPSLEHPKARSSNFFQDGEASLESGGGRGVQQETLQPGRYYLNPLLFHVVPQPVFEVPPGFVAVLRANLGGQLDRGLARPTPVATTSNDTFGGAVRSAAEGLLTSDRGRRGIWETPIAPGKYNLNPVAFMAYLVPTSAIMVDWAASERPGALSMSRGTTTPGADASNYPYLTDASVKGLQLFRFGQQKVTSKDAFQLEVDVRMVIRILPENAAFIIARFGSVFDLIQQIVHPLIGSSFRNNAGEKKALEFVQSRTEFQREALERPRTEFSHYMVEAQNLLISYIDVDSSLLGTQTQREIALQQQEQYRQQAMAEQQRIAVQEMTAPAGLQSEVVKAELQVAINANTAKALVKQAEGVRDSTVIKADGEATAVRKVGEAQADAYHARTYVLGADKVAFVRVMEQVRAGNVRITPDTLVSTRNNGGGASTLNSAYLAKLLTNGKSNHGALTEATTKGAATAT